MQWRKTGARYLVHLQRGEEIVTSLTGLLRQQDIRAASVIGIGALDQVTLRYFDLDAKKYEAQTFEGTFEIASLNGNVSLLDGQPWPHLHIVLSGTDYHCFGGHLHSGRVSITCELIMEVLEQPIERVLDSATTLKLWSL